MLASGPLPIFRDRSDSHVSDSLHFDCYSFPRVFFPDGSGSNLYLGSNSTCVGMGVVSAFLVLACFGPVSDLFQTCFKLGILDPPSLR